MNMERNKSQFTLSMAYHLNQMDLEQYFMILYSLSMNIQQPKKAFCRKCVLNNFGNCGTGSKYVKKNMTILQNLTSFIQLTFNANTIVLHQTAVLVIK